MSDATGLSDHSVDNSENVAPEWLVDIDGERALSWVQDHSDQARQRLAGPHFAELRDQIRDVLDSPDRIPFVTKRGDFAYNFWTDADHPRGLWRRMPFTDYLAGAESGHGGVGAESGLGAEGELGAGAGLGSEGGLGRRSEQDGQAELGAGAELSGKGGLASENGVGGQSWEILIDVDALAEAEGASWVWHGAQLLRPDFDRALITLSDGGTDEDITREFDLTTGSFVPDGFRRAASKGWMSWLDRDSVWLCTDFGPETLSSSGYPLQARLLRRGQAPEDALPVLTGGPEDLLTTIGHDFTPGWEYSFGQVAHDFYNGTYFVIPGTGPGSPEVSEAGSGSGAEAGSGAAPGSTGIPRSAASSGAGGGLDDLGWASNADRLPKELKPLALPVPSDADLDFWHGWALITTRSDWAELGLGTGVLVAISRHDLFSAAERGTSPIREQVQVLFEPDEHTVFQGLTATSQNVLITVTTDVVTHLLIAVPPETTPSTSGVALEATSSDTDVSLALGGGAKQATTRLNEASTTAATEVERPQSAPHESTAWNAPQDGRAQSAAQEGSARSATQESGTWTVTPLDLAGTDIPPFATISAGGVEATDSRVWLTVSGFVTPTSLYLADTQASAENLGQTVPDVHNPEQTSPKNPSQTLAEAQTPEQTSAEMHNPGQTLAEAQTPERASAENPGQTVPDVHNPRQTLAEANNSGQTSSEMNNARLAHVRLVRRAPELFDADSVQVSQHFAISADGTRVPYFQVGSGSAAKPTLLNGYGGFQTSLVPSYSGVIGRALLERGGTFVVANIRGGGEYGPAWHHAALKAKRPRAYEDFEAVARDLISRGVCSPSRLAIEGRSNGGLLTGNMLMRVPELFGAVVIGNPLLDMRRFHTLLAGASWMSEYGDPDDPEQWAFIRGFSPVHLFEPERQYPPTLITTSTRDDRVHPWHARALAWKMLEAGCDVTFFENTEGGHAGAADNAQRALMQALTWEFIWQSVGR